MKNVFLICWIWLIALSVKSYSQINPGLQNNNWVFTTQHILSFYPAPQTSSAITLSSTTLPQLPVAGSSLPFMDGGFEGTASVSDRLGRLLLVTDGISLWRFTGGQMDDAANYEIVIGPRGGQPIGFNGSSSSAQNAIFVPVPNTDSSFYLITLSGSSAPINYPGQRELGLHFSRIDIIEEANCTVRVNVTGPTVLMDNNGVDIDDAYHNICEGLTTTYNTTNNEYWLVTHVQHDRNEEPFSNDGVFLSYRITENGIGSDGINRMPTGDLGYSPFDPGGTVGVKCIKVSPNGQHFGFSTSGNGACIGDFDPTTGAFLTRYNELFNGSSYGVEFSADSNTFYYTRSGLVSFITAPYNNSNAPTQLLPNGAGTRGTLQLGIDGNVYLTTNNNPNLVIIAPDNTTTTFDLGTVSHYGLPQLVLDRACRDVLADIDDVPSGYEVNEERIESILLENVIQSGARAIYHAGNFIELLPDDCSGFEAEFGSQFTAYIEGCTGDFFYRGGPVNPQYGNNPVKESNLTKGSALQLHPNPANSILYLETVGINITEIQITAIDGKLIKTAAVRSNSESIDVSGFSKGMYLITIHTDDGQILRRKFLKN